MGHVLVLIALVAAGLVSLIWPWIGVVGGYFISTLTPQNVWWWDFQGVHPAEMILVPTIVGALVRLALGRLDIRALAARQHLWMAVLWLFLVLSHYLGPYADVVSKYRFSDPDWVLWTFNKIFALYFIAVLCITETKRLLALVVVMVVSVTYLTYWANYQYLSHHVFGRLHGPVNVDDTGIYSDENSFAMLFVVGIPFLWYSAQLFKGRILRYAGWLIIPFGWHSVFLTASRAGLLGIAFTTLLLAVRSKYRVLGLLLVPALVIAYFWQAGSLMRERAATIDEYHEDASAETRIWSWEAASRMIAAHPLTGVGLASYGPAFPDYSNKKPREAHDTLLQITAESGVFAGGAYALLVLGLLKGLWRNGRRLRARSATSREDLYLYLTNEATLVAIAGFVVCAMFASLQMYEVFYFLCAIAGATLYLGNRRLAEGPVPAVSAAAVASEEVRLTA